MGCHCVIQRFDHRSRGRFTRLYEGRIPLLCHRKERRLLIGRNAHEGCERREVFAVTLCHILREIVKVDGGKDIRLLRRPNLAVVGAAGGAAADAEGPTAEGPVGGRFHHLNTNGLLVRIVLPRQFPEATAWSRVRIASGSRKRNASLEREQRRYRKNEHSLYHKSSSVKELSVLAGAYH